jgi:hypothetical protein
MDVGALVHGMLRRWSMKNVAFYAVAFCVIGAVVVFACFINGCHSLYAEDEAALTQEVRLSTLAATHQADGGIGQMLDLSNACAARAIQVRHKLAPTPTNPFDAGCPQ